MSTGELVPPFFLEKKLSTIKGIKNTIVVGEGQHFISALVTLKKEKQQLQPANLRLFVDSINSSLPIPR